MQQDAPKRDPKKRIRLAKIIELRAQGMKNDEIAKHIGVSRWTVWRDLRTEYAQSFIDELVRRQLEDIEDEVKAMRPSGT